jgi:signal transduction histidine kinase
MTMRLPDDPAGRLWRLLFPRQPDATHAAAVERTLALVRIVIAVMSLAATWLDPSEAGLFSGLTVALLAFYTVFAVGRALLVRANPLQAVAWAPMLHGFELAWFALLSWVTGGVASPLHTLFFFSLLAAGFRWGMTATMVTAFTAVVVLMAQTAAVLLGLSAAPFHLNILIVRAGGVVLVGLLAGLLAENEHRLRESVSAVARIMRLVRMESGIVASVEAVLEELLARLEARRAILTVAEEGSDRRFMWEMTAGDAEGMRRVRPLVADEANARPFTFAIPAGANAWYAERPADEPARRAVFVALDAFGRAVSVRPPLESLLDAPFPWTSVHCLSSISGDGWSGRLFVFDSRTSGKRADQLRFLQVVLTQVGPALFNLYLQRRLQSRAGVTDRARAARELHDGVIQSLVGVEMMLEAMRRGLGAALPAEAASQLGAIQDIVRRENLNIRDLMQLLRPDDIDTSRLVEHLADLTARFQRHTGIQVRFVSDVEYITLPPRVCRELARAVHEALVNVRKHSDARNVLVRIAHGDGRWLVVVDDDGRGFDFEGRLTHEELDRQRRGPVILKEHVRAMGGDLAVHSQPGIGSRIEITVPGQRHA